MRVGIIGYWYATNYGSACTYYALYKELERMGHIPIIIDMPERESEPNWDKSFARKFITEHCMVSESVKWEETSKLNSICDAFVVGSDQIWNRDGYRISRGLFFLNFVNEAKFKVAYAPSLGSDNHSSLDAHIKNDIGNLLSRFDAISMREASGLDIIKNTYGVHSTHVIDPVFFLSKRDYNQIASDVSLPDEYILAYILDPDKDKELFILKIQEKYDLPVIVVLDGRYGTHDANKIKLNEYRDSVLSIDNVGEWITCFRKANVVITDSFHGMSIALIYSKQTYVYANHKRGYQRFVSLLDSLNLSHILFENVRDYLERSNCDINFKNLSSRIKSNVSMSKRWLEQALSIHHPHSCVKYQMNLKLRCSGCSACYSECPRNAISMKYNLDGFINPVIDEDKCTNCGKCSKVCRVLNPTYTNKSKPTCYAVWAKDKIRECSSSGGAFTVFANHTLDCGGHVYGAAYDGEFNVGHICIDSREDLWRLRGSKYIQSNLNNTFSMVKADLEKGIPVLYSGLPCQIAGLKSYLEMESNIESSLLTTVDLLCHGISPFSVFNKYRQDVLKDKELVDLQFKSKKPWGWHAGINATFADGSKYSCILEEDPYFVAYIRGLSKNTICGQCPFNKLPRQGDITIGDFWKIQDYKKELNDNMGTSLVLVNNDAGQVKFDSVKDNFQMSEQAPLEVAIAGNGCIIYPYKLHPSRDLFFKAYVSNDFQKIVESVLHKYPIPLPRDRPYYIRAVYQQAKIVYDNYAGREVILWGDNNTFRNVLKKYFGIEIKTTITSYEITSPNQKSPEYIIQHFSDIYVACFGRAYSSETDSFFKKYGLKYIKDYIYRQIPPIVLNDLDLSKGYCDQYGNVITGKGIVKKIIIRGYNNSVHFENDVHGCDNLHIDLSSNTKILIKKGVSFTQPFCEINTQGFDGDANVIVGEKCRFMRSLIRLFVNPSTSIVHIGDNTTFGDFLRIHVNSGKRLVIGKNSMISREVVFLGGDGHSIFDVTTGANINSIYSNLPPYRNSIILGEHVWVGDGAMIMHGTEVGDGAIIGARSVIKSKYANNLSVAGNPAKIIKENIAWAYSMCAKDMSCCGPYATLTTSLSLPVCGKDVLVIGGSQNNGINLIKELLERGNNVTVANRGNKDDGFGNRVSRLVLDVTSLSSVKSALFGKRFDTVYNNVAYSSISVRNILTNVQCNHYIQLSSIFVYDLHENMVESDFDISSKDVTWSNATGSYSYNKKISEIATKEFSKIHIVIVRIPYVYYTDRIDYYCDCIMNEKPMNISDVSRKLTFVSNWDLSKFLVWIPNQKYCGAINFSSDGDTSIYEIIQYIEHKTGKKAIIRFDDTDAPAPFSDGSFSLDLSNVKKIGYNPETLNSWLCKAIDGHIERIKKK